MSTQLSMNFQLLIKTKMLKNRDFSRTCLKTLIYVKYVLLVNVEIPTLVGILTFMSKINVMLSRAEHEKVSYPGDQTSDSEKL